MSQFKLLQFLAVEVVEKLTGLDLSFGLPMFPLNTDGIDVSGRNILIERCNITNYDDAVAIKPTNSGPNGMYPNYNNCTENIMVRDMIIN